MIAWAFGLRQIEHLVKKIIFNDLDLTDKIAAPATGGTPVTSINGSQYIGTVTWIGSPAVFLSNTTYTAVVDPTVKDGYTFSGVAEKCFLS
jgi:hypothetical protein